MNKGPTCSWDGARWTNPAGETCRKTHCALRGRCPGHVAEGLRTCPGCIRRTRRDLAAVVQLSTLLAFDALADGIESEAFNLTGPTIAPEVAAGRRALDQRNGMCEWPPAKVRAGDPDHPLTVLGGWVLALEEGGWLTRSDLLVTIAGAADRLDGVLDRFAHGDEFESFAREIRDLRTHLEAVDHDSRVPEQGRPCPTCAATREDGKGPRLVKRYAFHPGMRPGQRCADRLCDVCDGRRDAWHCPDEPGHAWSDAEYRLRLSADFVQYADALTASQIAERFPVKPGTIRKWAERGRVAKRGLDAHGRQRYDTRDVARMLEPSADAVSL